MSFIPSPYRLKAAAGRGRREEREGQIKKEIEKQ
jgi:hypothetical protein